MSEAYDNYWNGFDDGREISKDRDIALIKFAYNKGFWREGDYQFGKGICEKEAEQLLKEFEDGVD